MTIRRRDILKTSGLAAAGLAAGLAPLASAAGRSVQTRKSDVLVIGGGSAGTYAAVNLMNQGLSVTVLERKGRLGGHAETYVDPAKGTTVDIGVMEFENVPVVTQYLALLGAQAAPLSQTGGPPTAYYDLSTGQKSAYVPPTETELGEALYAYVQLLSTEFPYLDAGFQLPDPVPSDLLMPFGDFVTKYGLQALVPTIFQYAQGAGSLLKDPALYVLKLFSLRTSSAILSTGFLYLPAGTQSLYDNALQALGSSAVLNAQVLSVRRGGRAVEALAATPNGLVAVEAEKLVLAVPPLPWNLAFLDLTPAEFRLFSRLQAKEYASALIMAPGLPETVSIANADASAPYGLPSLPAVYGFEPTAIPGAFNPTFGGDAPLSNDAIERAIVRAVSLLGSSGSFPGAHVSSFLDYTNHAPFQIGVCAKDVANGFYSALNALQGQNRTWWTGAAWQTNDSSLIWSFTQGLLPAILA